MEYKLITWTIIIIIRHGHILLMVHHTITFVLGLLYIYFWMMARSLFLMVTKFCTMTIFNDNMTFSLHSWAGLGRRERGKRTRFSLSGGRCNLQTRTQFREEDQTKY